jgi:hypothetical protein
MAEFICYFNNIKYVYKSYFERDLAEQTNVYHRDSDKPAYIYRSKGKIELLYWFKHGKIHRDGDLPAAIRLMYNGYVKFHYYKNDNEYHRFIFYKLINIQRMIKIVYFIYKNKFIWSPSNLAGKFTKKQLLAMLLAALPSVVKSKN